MRKHSLAAYAPWIAAWMSYMAAGAVILSQAAETPRRPLPPIKAEAADWFEDVSDRAGVRFVHAFPHHRIANILLSNGSGGAVLDYDRDGFMDLFLVNWRPLSGVSAADWTGPRGQDRLFRNRGDGTFEDVTEKAGLSGEGYSHAAAAGDMDNDGYPDLYVVNAGRNRLLRNEGDGTFADITAQAGVGDAGTGISAVFVDVDRDGWLDLFVANYLTYKPQTESEQNPGAYPGPLAYPGETNVLYRNVGQGKFEDITRQAGLHAPGHRAMSVCAFDAERDGDPDLYVSNDDTPNALWINDGRGHFKEVAMDVGVAFNSIGEAPGSMNAAIGDFNRDGWPDLFITRLGYGSLYVRNPRGFYEDRIYGSGLGQLTQKYVGWGGATLDYDNDGDPDLFVANGDAFVLPGTLSLLLENQGDGNFKDAAARGGAFFRTPINGRAAATLDFDNDGREDVMVTALADRAVLLKNRAPVKAHWLKLALEGTRSNRSAHGALITATAGDHTWKTEATPATGFLIQGDPRVHLGLGKNSRVDRLEIRWPSGTTQILQNVAADQILTVREPKS